MKKKNILRYLMALGLSLSMVPFGVWAEEVQEVTQEGAEVGEIAQGASQKVVITGGQPWLDTTLKANITEGMETSPKEDFHLYVNYDWLKEMEIPAGKKSVMPLTDIHIQVQDRCIEILEGEEEAGHEGKLVRHLYQSLLNWEERNAQGVEPLRKSVEDVEAIESLEELTAFMCDSERFHDLESLVNIWLNYDQQDSSHYICEVEIRELLLTDAAEYGNRTQYGDRYYQATLNEVLALLPRLGYTEEEAKEKLSNVLSFEEKLAEKMFTQEEMTRSEFVNQSYHPCSAEELKEMCESFPLWEYMDSVGLGDLERYNIAQPEAIARIEELYTGENLEALKDLIILDYVLGNASLLDREAYEAWAAYQAYISGTSGVEEDKIEALKVVSNLLGYAMDRAYVEAGDFGGLRDEVYQIIQDTVEVYREMLGEETWLTEETRTAAIEKLDNMRINCLYPDKWKDYSDLELEGLSLYESISAISDFYLMDMKEMLSHPVDQAIWDLDCLDLNAYYNPGNNSINILLGFMGMPIYYEGISREELLGGIGCVIGHEISHAFDTTGAMFDKDGNKKDWWQREDYEEFQARAQKMIDYYNQITVWEGSNVIGENIVTEAIADMGGLKAMLTLAAKDEDFDYDAFFKSFARLWARLNTWEKEYYSYTRDPHPLHMHRTNCTLQQFDRFLSTYDIQEGDTMYLAPEDRVCVW